MSSAKDIFYRFSMSREHIVDAEDVRFRKDAYPDGFRCLGCNEPLIARTDGKHKRPHFAHANDSNCGGETYLHQLAKRRFVERFEQCKRRHDPFRLELWHEARCPGAPNPFFDGCVLQHLRDSDRIETCVVAHDLTEKYRIAGLECQVGGFVADVLLQHTEKDEDQILIEFAITHKLTEAKKSSGFRIIEFDIVDEQSVDLIFDGAIRCDHPSPWRSEQLGTNGTTVVGFKPRPQQISVEQCGCFATDYRLFIHYKSGKVFLTSGTLQQLASRFDEYRSVIANWRLYFPSEERHRFSYISKPNYTEPEDETFSRAAWDMKTEGVTIKNCVLCHHRGKDRYRNRKLFCFARRQAFDSNNEGATCNHFQWKRQFSSKGKTPPF